MGERPVRGAFSFFAYLVAVSFSNTASLAATVKYSFTADQNFLFGIPSAGSLVETLSPFATISGTFSYDLAAPGGSNLPGYGAYQTGSLSIDQIALPASATTNPLIQIFDDPAYQFDANDTFFLTFQSQSEGIGLQLTGPPDTFSGVFLPTSIDLAAFTIFYFLEFHDLNSFPGTRINFAFTSISPLPLEEVPVPGAAILFLTAAFGGFDLRRRRARKLLVRQKSR